MSLANGPFDTDEQPSAYDFSIGGKGVRLGGIFALSVSESDFESAKRGLESSIRLSEHNLNLAQEKLPGNVAEAEKTLSEHYALKALTCLDERFGEVDHILASEFIEKAMTLADNLSVLSQAYHVLTVIGDVEKAENIGRILDINPIQSIFKNLTDFMNKEGMLGNL
jgi:hypothetical protein